MNYLWYIIDRDDGAVFGTDSEVEADNLAMEDSYVVIDNRLGKVYTIDEENIGRWTTIREV